MKQNPGGDEVAVRRSGAGSILFIDVAISVLSSIIILLIMRWSIKVIPDFQYCFLRTFIASSVASILGCIIAGSHKVVIRYASLRSIARVAEAVLVKELLMLVFGLVGLLVFKSIPHPFLALFADCLLSLFLLVAARVIIIFVYESLEDNMEVNVSRLDVMVYGTSDKSVAMVARLDQSSHYNVLGFLSPDKSRDGMILMDKKIYAFSTVEDLKQLKVSKGIAGILFAREDDVESEKDGLIQLALQCGIHILSTPKIQEVKFDGVSKSAIKDVVDSDFIPDGMTALERHFKRLVDFILSTVLIIVFSPLMIICALAVFFKGGEGPIIYKQERIGRFGRPFNIYKFRTMCQNAEPNGAALYSGDDDPRLTKVGRFLRVHHLDELPQLFNVFKGDMAFIGYRPERKFYIDKIMEEDPRYYYLYQIRPGVTSYSTLKNGYADSMQKMLRRLEFDLYYLRHRSAWFDIKILWQTFINIVFGKQF